MAKTVKNKGPEREPSGVEAPHNDGTHCTGTITVEHPTINQTGYACFPDAKAALIEYAVGRVVEEQNDGSDVVQFGDTFEYELPPEPTEP